METGNADNKKRAAFFQSCSFFWRQVVCGTEGGTTDWNSPAEQRKRPKGDRFIALLFEFIVSDERSVSSRANFLNCLVCNALLNLYNDVLQDIGLFVDCMF